ncbi:hypothetical protein D3C76_1661670 [compost metagenome]
MLKGGPISVHDLHSLIKKLLQVRAIGCSEYCFKLLGGDRPQALLIACTQRFPLHYLFEDFQRGAGLFVPGARGVNLVSDQRM